MPKPYYKKEIVYYTATEAEAKDLKSDLQDTYDNVQIYYNGKEECKVVCEII